MDEIGEIIQLIRGYGRFDEAAFANCEMFLRQHLTSLGGIEEPGQSHSGESTLMHTYNVVKAIHSILQSLKQQSYELPFLEQLYKLVDQARLQGHLLKKVGNYDRYTLLFFATLFHDIGKLGHFVQTGKSLAELSKYVKHAFLGGFMINFSAEGLNAVEAEVKRLEAEFAQLKAVPEKTEKQKKSYEEARQLIVQLKLVRREIKKHFNLLNDLNFSQKDIEYLVFVVSNHIRCYDSFQMYSQIIQNLNDNQILKKINSLRQKILEMIAQFGDYFYDIVLFFVSDKLGTGGFAQAMPESLVKYVEIANLLYNDNTFDIAKCLIN
ncbi:MAG: hypothetical protein QXM31_03705 [Candidatus Woesearchaeota archaeon]